jgi:hypothetical protein
MPLARAKQSPEAARHNAGCSTAQPVVRVRPHRSPQHLPRAANHRHPRPLAPAPPHAPGGPTAESRAGLCTTPYSRAKRLASAAEPVIRCSHNPYATDSIYFCVRYSRHRLIP